MPTLSTCIPAASKVARQPLRHRHRRRPAQPGLRLFVAVARLLPIPVPSLAVQHGGELALRPARVALPRPTQRVAYGVRHVDRRKAPGVTLVQAQQLPAGWKIVVDDVEDLSID